MAHRILALDVGNTHTVVGLFQGRELAARWRLSTHGERTADETGLWLRQMIAIEGLEAGDLDDVAVASVVPMLDPQLREAVKRYLDLDPFFVEPGIRTGMPLRVEAPQEL
ncbi:MAG: type III pantothenate kinase, partial [Acidobacteria bacterium]|nr:type III pantothenate kinase [Acidobacteriota bacterium]